MLNGFESMLYPFRVNHNSEVLTCACACWWCLRRFAKSQLWNHCARVKLTYVTVTVMDNSPGVNKHTPEADLIVPLMAKLRVLSRFLKWRRFWRAWMGFVQRFCVLFVWWVPGSIHKYNHTFLCCICMNSELNDFEHTAYFFIGAVVENRSANILCVFSSYLGIVDTIKSNASVCWFSLNWLNDFLVVVDFFI